MVLVKSHQVLVLAQLLMIQKYHYRDGARVADKKPAVVPLGLAVSDTEPVIADIGPAVSDIWPSIADTGRVMTDTEPS